jgi:hypothetical protein
VRCPALEWKIRYETIGDIGLPLADNLAQLQ